MKSKKISVSQFFIMYSLPVLAPAIRLFPTLLAEKSGGKSYIPIIIGAVLSFVMIFLFSLLMKKNSGASLAELTTDILGKPLGIVLLFIYLIWSFLLFSLYIRFYAEQISVSLLPECRMETIIAVMLIFCFYVFKSSILSSARLLEILFVLFAVVFLLITIFTLVQDFDIYNIEFMGNFNLEKITEGSIVSFAVYSYIVFMFFFFDKVKYSGDFLKTGFKAMLCTAAAGIMIFLSTVGVLGAGASSHLYTPYFSVVKNLSVFNTLERFEALIFSIWIVVDFAVIYIFGYISLTLFKKIFNTEKKDIMTVPLLLLGFSTALFAGNTSFEVESLSSNFMIYGNSLLALFIIPLLLIVGKIRKKV